MCVGQVLPAGQKSGPWQAGKHYEVTKLWEIRDPEFSSAYDRALATYDGHRRANPDAPEIYLYHGTSPGSFRTIVTRGYDMGVRDGSTD